MIVTLNGLLLEFKKMDKLLYGNGNHRIIFSINMADLIRYYVVIIVLMEIILLQVTMMEESEFGILVHISVRQYLMNTKVKSQVLNFQKL